MTNITALQAGLNGVYSGMKSLNQNAAKIANANIESTHDLTEPLVNILQSEQQVKASAKVIEASNTMLGSILDIKA